MNFGLEKQLDRIVETLALQAIINSLPLAKDCSIEALAEKNKCRNRLREIAFPLEVMEEISENEDLTALFESAVE